MLSVVAVGLYLGRLGPRIVPAATRVQAESMWVMVQFILESLVFILVGLELPYVLPTLRTHPLGTLLRYGALITATVIGVRLVYTLLAASLIRRSAPGHAGRRGRPSWRQIAFLGWAGMRGGDSLVSPWPCRSMTAAGEPFPARGLIIFLTFAVILATLVLQGLTLAPLIRWWGLTEGESATPRRPMRDGSWPRPDSDGSRRRPRATAWIARRRDTWRPPIAAASSAGRPATGSGTARQDEDHARLAGVDGGRAERLATAYRALRAAMIEDEREALVRLRDQGVIGDDVLRRVQRDLDLETMLLESAEDGAPQSPYEVE